MNKANNQISLNNTSDIGPILKQIRKERKITQLELAEYAGLSRAGIAKIEAGDSDIKLSTLISISTLLGLDIYLEKRGSV